jgi:RNA recognition motif-containing protein
VSVTVPTDRDSGRPRGFAFVEMSTAEQAAAVQERFNGSTLRGRPLRIDAATERSPGAVGSMSAGSPHRPAGSFAPGRRSRPKGSRRNLRARKRGF